MDFELKKVLTMICLAIGCVSSSAAQTWVPPGYSIPANTISPNGCYGVMLPIYDRYGFNEPNQLVDMKTGQVLAKMAGVPGWLGGSVPQSMRWGDMEAKWSADSTTLCWVHPDKWFPESYVVLKVINDRVVWQVELMKPADREMLARTETSAPLNFAISKIDNAGDGSAYPEGFVIDVSEPEDKFSLPLVCRVSLTNNCKVDQVQENGVHSLMNLTLGENGRLTYSDFKVERGPLSPDAAEQIKEHTVSVPLVNTDIGKAMLFPGLQSKDRAYAVGWTVQPDIEDEPPVDWSEWDPINPDKLLRKYDWQYYGYDSSSRPYTAVDFILNTHTGNTALLPSECPSWPGKRNDWEVSANWYLDRDGKRYALIENDQKPPVKDVWLADLGKTQMQVKVLTATMRKAVDNLLRERRPEVAATDFMVYYTIPASKELDDNVGLIPVPFEADAPSSDQKEYQLNGEVTIRLSNGTIVGASSDQKHQDPFVDDEALKKADGELNAFFQTLLKRLSPEDARALMKEERAWITQRDADADQAVNILPEGSSQEKYEEARENSLLESTWKRIQELELRNR